VSKSTPFAAVASFAKGNFDESEEFHATSASTTELI
jgi:hypothetical protein